VEYFLLTSRKVGVRSKPPRKRRIGMVSPVRVVVSLRRHLLNHAESWLPGNKIGVGCLHKPYLFGVG